MRHIDSIGTGVCIAAVIGSDDFDILLRDTGSLRLHIRLHIGVPPLFSVCQLVVFRQLIALDAAGDELLAAVRTANVKSPNDKVNNEQAANVCSLHAVIIQHCRILARLRDIRAGNLAVFPCVPVFRDGRFRLKDKDAAIR